MIFLFYKTYKIFIFVNCVLQKIDFIKIVKYDVIV